MNIGNNNRPKKTANTISAIIVAITIKVIFDSEIFHAVESDLDKSTKNHMVKIRAVIDFMSGTEIFSIQEPKSAIIFESIQKSNTSIKLHFACTIFHSQKYLFFIKDTGDIQIPSDKVHKHYQTKAYRKANIIYGMEKDCNKNSHKQSFEILPRKSPLLSYVYSGKKICYHATT